MTTRSDILALARQRQQSGSLPYAGAVTPSEAYALLQADTSVKLIDVRTQAERDWVGKVDIPRHSTPPCNGPCIRAARKTKIS